MDLQQIRKQIERKYKVPGHFPGESARFDIDVIPTGLPLLDLTLGVGGWPKGRIIEAYGGESSGKSTLLLQSAAETQKQGGTAVLVEPEQTFVTEYAQALGVDTDKLLVIQPDTAEQAMGIILDLIKSGVDFIGLDSIAAMVPLAVIQGDVGDAHVGLKARLMSQVMPQIATELKKTGGVLFMVNQIRDKIGVMYGDPTTTPGGWAVPFHASIRLALSSIKVKMGGTSNVIVFRVKKNKVATPFTSCEIPIEYGKGFSATSQYFDVGVTIGLIEQGGAWFTFSDGEKTQGKEAGMQYLEDNPHLMQEIQNALKTGSSRTAEPEAQAIS